jgi:hypothetical protein
MKNQLRSKHWVLLAVAAVALIVVPRTAAAGNWSVNNASDLIGAINAANQVGGANTIILAGGRTFTLTAVNNTTDGPTGLPVIAANNGLTIRGNGATLARSAVPGTPAFRLFDVASGAALTLQNLTLANGQVIGDTGKDAHGGAILNAAGAFLTVKNSALVGNQAVGGDGGGKAGGWAFGGAIWNNGTASIDSVVFRGNQAQGGAHTGQPNKSGGGSAFGGAILSATAGTLTVANCSFTGNRAVGGLRHKPSGIFDAMALAGAIENWGAVSISDTMFTDNQAVGGASDPGVAGGVSVAGAVESGTPHSLSPVCTIQRCTFNHNQAIGGNAGDPSSENGEGDGGALSHGFARGAATLTITDCSFTDNEAIGGNGGWGGAGLSGVLNVESSPFSATVTLTTIANSTFTENKAIGRGAGGQGIGGAISSEDYTAGGGAGATLLVSNCTFTGNEAVGAPGGDAAKNGCFSAGKSGVLDLAGNTTILSSVFEGNRAIGAALQAGAKTTPLLNVLKAASSGGALTTWGGTLEIRDTSFVENQVLAGDGSLGGPPCIAMGGGITIYSGRPATLINCWLINNTAAGGAGGSGGPGAPGVGGGLNVGVHPGAYAATGPSSAVTLTGTIIRHNQAIGGANGGQGLGGGYAVGIGAIFGDPDTSSVTLDGGSVVTNNLPDDVFQF